MVAVLEDRKKNEMGKEMRQERNIESERKKSNMKMFSISLGPRGLDVLFGGQCTVQATVMS
jgi:hypothetical protein